jgi:hypothetical protein
MITSGWPAYPKKHGQQASIHIGGMIDGFKKRSLFSFMDANLVHASTFLRWFCLFYFFFIVK